MNVLSLFDGIACGRLALDRAGFKVDKYFASEIEPNAIRVANRNWPDIIQVGDVTELTGEDLPEIDLLMGGSPCQGFSYNGKQLNFDDPRSKLFFDFVRLLEETEPQWFLLENVRMKKQYQDVISEYLGVEPVFINSQLVSAQDRKRLYWTNIPIRQEFLQQQGIQFEGVLDYMHYDSPLFLSDETAARYVAKEEYWSDRTKSCVIGKLKNGHQGDRVFDTACKASCLLAGGGNNGGGGCNLIFDPHHNKLRRLSVTECERLQNLPEGYTAGIAATRAYSAIGNAWTVNVIVAILKGMRPKPFAYIANPLADPKAKPEYEVIR